LQHLGQIAEVTVVAPVVKRNASIPSRRTDESVTVLHPRWIYLPGTGALTVVPLFLRLLLTVWKVSKTQSFDVLDSHFGYPEGIATALVAATTKIPFTVTLRGSELLHAQYPLRRWLMGWAFRRASRIIAVSGELATFAISLGAPEERVVTISNGVERSVFFPRVPNPDLNPNVPIIVTAGYLIELKGHHRVIDALKALRDRGLDARLAIVGGPPGPGLPGFEPQLRQQVTRLGLESAVEFLGEIDQSRLAQVMSEANVFCLASSREGCPNVVLEALACGTPVVAARVGAVPDLIPSDHVGFIVPAGHQQELESALHKALTIEWDRPAIVRWAQSRSWEMVAREVLTTLQEAIEPKAGAIKEAGQVC